MDMRARRLKGRVTLIAGGTDGVGEGIVRAFLRGGAVVVVPSSSAEQLERLRDALQDVPTEDLVTIFGDVGRLDEAERIRDVLLGRVGRLDAVVASLGRWCRGQSLAEVSLECWERTLRENLTAQFIVIHTFMPLLIAQGHGSYTLLKRTDPEDPIAHVGTGAVTGSAQEMLVRTLVEEVASTDVQINEVIVCPDRRMDQGARDPADRSLGECVGTFTAWLASEEGLSVRGAMIRPGHHPSTPTR